MNITIKDKDIELRFGVGFVRDMDKRVERTEQGVEFQLGLALAIEKIKATGSMDALLEVVQSAIKHEGEYTIEEIESAIDAMPEEEQALFLENLQTRLSKAPVVQNSLKKLEDMQKEAEKKGLLKAAK